MPSPRLKSFATSDEQATPSAHPPSLKLNYLYNTSLSALNVVVPLITFSYIARVFGPAILGRVTMAMSLASFATLAAGLGVPVYGAREIARVRDDVQGRSRLFSELVALSFVSSVAVSGVYAVVVFATPQLRSDAMLFLLAGLQVTFSFIGVDWFYQGIENYRYIALRNILIRLLVLGMVFVVVRSAADYYHYVFLGMLGIVGSKSIGFARALTLVHLSLKGAVKGARKHLSSSLFLFGSAVTASIYVYLDSVMLGLLCSDATVGLYSAAIKVCRISILMIVSLGAVLIPRLSYYLQKGDTDAYHRTAQRSLHAICLLTFPMAAGIIALAPVILRTVAGAEFSEATFTLRISALVLPIIGYTNFLGQQVFMANRQERKLFISTLVAGIVSVLANVTLAPFLRHNGTAIAVLLAEASVLCVQVALARRFCAQFRFFDRQSLRYLGTSLTMGGLAWLAAGILPSTHVSLLIGVVTGICAYAGQLAVFRDPLTLELAAGIMGHLRRNVRTCIK